MALNNESSGVILIEKMKIWIKPVKGCCDGWC